MLAVRGVNIDFPEEVIAEADKLADAPIPQEEYDKRLRTFAPEDLVPIMKSVHERTVRRVDSGRRITATDKKYFDLAEGLLCDELAVSLAVPRENVKDVLVERVKRAEALRR